MGRVTPASLEKSFHTEKSWIVNQKVQEVLLSNHMSPTLIIGIRVC